MLNFEKTCTNFVHKTSKQFKMLPLQERVEDIIIKNTNLNQCPIDPEKILKELKKDLIKNGCFSAKKIEDLKVILETLRQKVKAIKESKFNVENKIAVEQMQKE